MPYSICCSNHGTVLNTGGHKCYLSLQWSPCRCLMQIISEQGRVGWCRSDISPRSFRNTQNASTTHMALFHQNHCTRTLHMSLSCLLGNVDPPIIYCIWWVNVIVNPMKVLHRSHKVCAHAVASLDFSCNQQAGWLSIANAILYFTRSVPADHLVYKLRIGNMPSYSSVYCTLWSFSDQETAVTKAPLSS
jgi:hypothetical protein